MYYWLYLPLCLQLSEELRRSWACTCWHIVNKTNKQTIVDSVDVERYHFPNFASLSNCALSLRPVLCLFEHKCTINVFHSFIHIEQHVQFCVSYLVSSSLIVIPDGPAHHHTNGQDGIHSFLPSGGLDEIGPCTKHTKFYSKSTTLSPKIWGVLSA